MATDAHPTVTTSTPVTIKDPGSSGSDFTLSIHRIASAATATSQGPSVVLLHGMGSISAEWAYVLRQLAQSSNHVYAYDRPGSGSSVAVDVSKLAPRTAQRSAAELLQLLHGAGVPAPWVLVGHSFGGVIIRELLDIFEDAQEGQRLDSIHGLVFVDHAVSFADLPPAWDALVGDGDYAQIVGIRTPPDGYTAAEWKAAEQAAADSAAGMAAEEAESLRSWADLKRLDAKQFISSSSSSSQDPSNQPTRKTPLLGRRPVSVIHANSALDFQNIHAYAVQHGHGAAIDAGPGWARTDERLQRRLLTLSANSRWVDLPHDGHSPYITRPDVIVEQVKWVLSSAVASQ